MATQKVYASYQEVIDMHTESGHCTAIGIHTPVGDTPRKMFQGFFDQFKRMKYLGCSISFVPVATLPADPLNVSYDAGEPGIDPRDLVNPIMFHGCHGDDMGTILNKLYGDNLNIADSVDGIDVDAFSGVDSQAMADALHRLYYKALTDNTWKKAHPQRGFRKSGLKPLVYSMASNRQIGMGMSPWENGDIIIDPTTGALKLGGGDCSSDIDDEQGILKINKTGVQIFTPKLTSLGWIDTRNALTGSVLFTPPETVEEAYGAMTKALVDQINYAELPKIFMGVILLAPAYKTELYFRVIINHHFAFKDFRGISFKPEVTGVPSVFDAEEEFSGEPMFPDIDLPSDDPEEDTCEIGFKFYNGTTASKKVSFYIGETEIDSITNQNTTTASTATHLLPAGTIVKAKTSTGSTYYDCVVTKDGVMKFSNPYSGTPITFGYEE